MQQFSNNYINIHSSFLRLNSFIKLIVILLLTIVVITYKLRWLNEYLRWPKGHGCWNFKDNVFSFFTQTETDTSPITGFSLEQNLSIPQRYFTSPVEFFNKPATLPTPSFLRWISMNMLNSPLYEMIHDMLTMHQLTIFHLILQLLHVKIFLE